MAFNPDSEERQPRGPTKPVPYPQAPPSAPPPAPTTGDVGYTPPTEQTPSEAGPGRRHPKPLPMEPSPPPSAEPLASPGAPPANVNVAATRPAGPRGFTPVRGRGASLLQGLTGHRPSFSSGATGGVPSAPVAGGVSPEAAALLGGLGGDQSQGLTLEDILAELQRQSGAAPAPMGGPSMGGGTFGAPPWGMG